MSVDHGTVNWSAPEVLLGREDYTARARAFTSLLYSAQL
jgi:hypothetical protein